jgi:ADP-ribosylglycohydrolase
VKITAPDTVPFALWLAARNLGDYERALWEGVAGLGDTDTVCAITGGVVVLATGVKGIPAAWRRAREPLPA